MKTKHQDRRNDGTRTGRRAFLRSSLLAGGAAAAVLTSAPSVAETAEVVKPGARGYRKTAHVRRYYDSARRI